MKKVLWYGFQGLIIAAMVVVIILIILAEKAG